jgi:hypothetical protein
METRHEPYHAGKLPDSQQVMRERPIRHVTPVDTGYKHGKWIIKKMH